MKKALLKDCFKQIIKTNKRFISILLMALLGVGFFSGVRTTSPDMEKLMDVYLDKQDIYDIKLVSTLGLTDDDLKEVSKVEGVEAAYGIYSEDVFLTVDDVEKVISVIQNDDNINKLNLIEGRIPQSADECVIDNSMQIAEDININDVLEIRESLEKDEDPTFKNTKLKVVGVAKSPLYISRDRGTTSLGSGKVDYFIYANKDNFNNDFYTEIAIKAKDVKELNYFSDIYDEKVNTVIDNIDKIKDTRQQARYEELVDEANTKLNDAQKEFEEKKAEGEQEIRNAEKKIEDGKKDIKNAEKKISDGEKELKEGRETANKEFADAEAQLGSAQDQIIRNQEALDDQKIYFEAKKKEAEDGKNQINAGLATINVQLKDLQDNKALAEKVLNGIATINSTLGSLNSALAENQSKLEIATDEKTKQELTSANAYINSQIKDLTVQKQELEAYGITQDKLNQINSGIDTCNAEKQKLETQIKTIDTEITEGERKLIVGQNELNNGWNKVQSGKQELANKRAEAEQKFADAEKEIEKGKKDLEKGKQDLKDGEQELNDAKHEFDEKIKEAEGKIIDAREKINDLETTKWYILDRSNNTGFNSFSQDTDNVEKLGKVFPVVFFLIAVLISLTTMSRMVEEERVQIGTLKGLGYNKIQIMSKYIIYSLLAAVTGGVIGALFGQKFFPYIIIIMYGMMYDMPPLYLDYNLVNTVTGIGLMILCIVGATVFTANKELSSTPAELMRPKAPKAGKRVLLEKIPFIWKRLSFTQKVTLRNMFRYKKRFLMTVVGISGCTALILAGFGLKDSVSGIMDYQYIDIYNYDMMIGLNNSLTIDEINKLIEDLESDNNIEKCSKVHMLSDSVEKGELNQDAQIFIVDNDKVLEDVIRLKNVKTGEKLTLNDNEVIITDKLAQLIKCKVGDEIIIKDSDEKEHVVKVGGITEHYISHYVYMTNNLYKKEFNEELNPNILLATYSGELSSDVENELSEKILSDSKVASVTLSSYLMKLMDDTLSSMNIVVYILIISAGLLAFIVLYNLANVNISERIRELATIKVLGFYDKEVYDYITREIVLLTIIGIILGLGLGILLSRFILGTCEIGILRFKKVILPQSYCFAAIITTIFTYIVNFITYFSLKKVDMIESLKSIE